MRPLELGGFGRVIWRGSRERRVLIQAGSNGGHDQGGASREKTGTSIILHHFIYSKTFPIYFSPIFLFLISFLVGVLLLYRFPGGSLSKESTCNAGEAGNTGQSLSQEDPLETGMATYSSILAWRIPWAEEPERLESIVSQRVRHD